MLLKFIFWPKAFFLNNYFICALQKFAKDWKCYVFLNRSYFFLNFEKVSSVVQNLEFERCLIQLILYQLLCLDCGFIWFHYVQVSAWVLWNRALSILPAVVRLDDIYEANKLNETVYFRLHMFSDHWLYCHPPFYPKI